MSPFVVAAVVAVFGSLQFGALKVNQTFCMLFDAATRDCVCIDLETL